MHISHSIGDRVYAVIPHPGGALVVVGTVHAIHVETTRTTAVLVTAAGEEATAPLEDVRACDGRFPLYGVEDLVFGVVANLLADILAPKKVSDPAPAPPPGAVLGDATGDHDGYPF